MELFKSYSKENAVKVIAFAMNFEKELSSIQISELIDRLKENENLNSNFSEQQIQNIVSIITKQDGTSSQENSIGGIVFNKKEENKLLWSLIFDKNRVVVTCRDYSRWDKISFEALNYINIVFNELEASIKITQLTLEYLDEFEILEPTLSWKEKLFKSNCKYITPNIYDLDNFWHISQGYFINLKDIDENILDTVDINYFADEQDNLKHKVNIRMQHKLYYNSLIIYNKDDIKDYFHAIHLHSKDILFKIVDDKVTDTFDIGEKL